MSQQQVSIQHTRPLTVNLLIGAILVQGLSGVAGGIGLVFDPSGESLGIPNSWLAGSPFADYLIPGVILLVLLGIVPLANLFGLWMRQYWGWLGALLIGFALLIWIGVEILIIGYQPQPPLQLIYGLLGVVTIILALLPSVRAYFSRPS